MPLRIDVIEKTRNPQRTSVKFNLMFNEVKIGDAFLEVFDHQSSLEMMIVQHNFRGKRIGNTTFGKSLMQGIIDYLDQKKLSCKLMPVSNNPTHSYHDKKISEFYAKYGFVFESDLVYMRREPN